MTLLYTLISNAFKTGLFHLTGSGAEQDLVITYCEQLILSIMNMKYES